MLPPVGDLSGSGAEPKINSSYPVPATRRDRMTARRLAISRRYLARRPLLPDAAAA
jgi:hypothetical protein